MLRKRSRTYEPRGKVTLRRISQICIYVRHSADISQAVLGGLLDVTASSVCCWEKQRRRPTYARAFVLEEIYAGRLKIKKWPNGTVEILERKKAKKKKRQFEEDEVRQYRDRSVFDDDY